jgi:hypothetical protein
VFLSGRHLVTKSQLAAIADREPGAHAALIGNYNARRRVGDRAYQRRSSTSYPLWGNDDRPT